MNHTEFAAILKRHARIAIAGGPSSGKTTLASLVRDRPVIATDDTMGSAWEDQPLITIRRVEGLSAFVVEGVQVARALRKGLQVDAVIIMGEPYEELTTYQRSMQKGCEKIMREVLAMRPELTVYQ